jgi:predicted exporter
VGSLRQSVRRVVPVIAAVLLTVAALLLIGQSLTLFHLVTLLLVAGVGINYALFFGQPAADAVERAATLRSIAVAGLATLCASLALATTDTAVLRAIGLTMLIGTLAAFSCAAAFSRDNLPAPPGSIR